MYVSLQAMMNVQNSEWFINYKVTKSYSSYSYWYSYNS